MVKKKKVSKSQENKIINEGLSAAFGVNSGHGFPPDPKECASMLQAKMALEGRPQSEGRDEALNAINRAKIHCSC